MSVIAKNYRRPLSELLAANPSIVNPGMIYPGQQIVIPGLPEPASIPYTIIVSKGKRSLTLYITAPFKKCILLPSEKC